MTEKSLIKKSLLIFNLNEINLINTPLQLINLIEYNFKYNYKNFNKPKKIFVFNSFGRELDQMVYIKKN